jgi:periplasmic divalent cation tolerance protein
MVKQNHSYDVPEIIAMPIISGSKEYLSWLREESSGR